MLGHGTTCLEGVQLACGYTGGFGPVNCTYVWSVSFSPKHHEYIYALASTM